MICPFATPLAILSGMPTHLENLITARDQIAQLIVDITANPKPSYSIGSQSVSWSDYLSMLNGQYTELNKTIQALRPYTVISRWKA